MQAAALFLKRSAVVLATAALAIVLALVFGQVIMRMGLDSPLPWPEELGRIAFVYLVFIGAAEASVAQTHIAVDVVDAFGISRRIDRILGVVRDLATLAVLAVIIFGAWTMIPVVHSMKLPATGLPMSSMVLPVLVGGGMMALATLLHLLAHATGRPLPTDPPAFPPGS